MAHVTCSTQSDCSFDSIKPKTNLILFSAKMSYAPSLSEQSWLLQVAKLLAWYGLV